MLDDDSPRMGKRNRIISTVQNSRQKTTATHSSLGINFNMHDQHLTTGENTLRSTAAGGHPAAKLRASIFSDQINFEDSQLPRGELGNKRFLNTR